jgi:hypothetical protein
MSWFRRNAEVVEAIAACVTAVVALCALIGIKFQLDATEKLQLAQSARDTYRTHLALAVSHADFAAPLNGCAIIGSDRAGGYAAFVDHLLYSAEQMLVVEDGWEGTFMDQLAPHVDYMCSVDGPKGETEKTAALLTQFRGLECSAEPRC